MAPRERSPRMLGPTRLPKSACHYHSGGTCTMSKLVDTQQKRKMRTSAPRTAAPHPSQCISPPHRSRTQFRSVNKPYLGSECPGAGRRRGAAERGRDERGRQRRKQGQQEEQARHLLCLLVLCVVVCVHWWVGGQVGGRAVCVNGGRRHHRCLGQGGPVQARRLPLWRLLSPPAPSKAFENP